MKIKLTSLYVDDQAKALRFYTEILGFAKKADFTNGPFRWLTVASPEEPDGTELQLALNNNPAAQAYGPIRAALEKAGTPIGANDLLIAATAVAHGLTLVTHNTREFSRVVGLAIEDWE